MIFVTNHKTAEVVDPRKSEFDPPSSAVSTESSHVSRWRQTITAILRNQVNATLLAIRRRASRTSVHFVTDELLWQILRPCSIKGNFNQRYLVRKSVGNLSGDRNTMAVWDRHDLASLAAFPFADCVAPFFGSREGAVDKGFGQIDCATLRQILGQCGENLGKDAKLGPRLEPSMAGLVWRISLGQVFPGRPSSEGPQDAVEYIARRPPSPARFPLHRRHMRLDASPSFVGNIDAA